MKNILFGLVLTTIITACQRQGCTDSSAANYEEKAKKDNGSCEYPDPAADYYGTYYMVDSLFEDGSFLSVSTYSMTIGSNGEIGKLELNYLHGISGAYSANFNATELTFTIPEQTVTQPYAESGSGYFENNKVYFTIQGDNHLYKGNGHR